MKALDRIRRAIASRKGNVILRSDLKKFGSPATITRCLKILCDKEMQLLKISHGMYAKSRKVTINRPFFKGDLVDTFVSPEQIFAEALDRLGVVYELSRAERNHLGGMRQMPCGTTFEVFRSNIKRKIYVGQLFLKYQRYFKRPEDIVWYKYVPNDDDIYGETEAIPLDFVPPYSIIERKKKKCNA